MKIRQGFVSNSSSSSFVVSLRDLTHTQLDKLMNHRKWGKKYKIEYADDEWELFIKEGMLWGATLMANFNMSQLMEKIGVDLTKVGWDDGDGSPDVQGTVSEYCERKECSICDWRFYCMTTND